VRSVGSLVVSDYAADEELRSYDHLATTAAGLQAPGVARSTVTLLQVDRSPEGRDNANKQLRKAQAKWSLLHADLEALIARLRESAEEVQEARYVAAKYTALLATCRTRKRNAMTARNTDRLASTAKQTRTIEPA